MAPTCSVHDISAGSADITMLSLDAVGLIDYEIPIAIVFTFTPHHFHVLQSLSHSSHCHMCILKLVFLISKSTYAAGHRTSQCTDVAIDVVHQIFGTR